MAIDRNFTFNQLYITINWRTALLSVVHFVNFFFSSTFDKNYEKHDYDLTVIHCYKLFCIFWLMNCFRKCVQTFMYSFWAKRFVIYRWLGRKNHVTFVFLFNFFFFPNTIYYSFFSWMLNHLLYVFFWIYCCPSI